jgi:hypothetical protein
VARGRKAAIDLAAEDERKAEKVEKAARREAALTRPAEDRNKGEKQKVSTGRAFNQDEVGEYVNVVRMHLSAPVSLTRSMLAVNDCAGNDLEKVR